MPTNNDSLNNDTKITILVAEDSPADRMILESMLLKAGHKVILAEDGVEAVERFESLRPDMVFLDVIMPNMDGIEAAQKIKKISADELTPVIFLTSLADAKSLAICLESGGDDFLSKPFNSIILSAKIQAFQRMREMNQTLNKQKNVIEKNNRNLIEEQAIAKQVFDKVSRSATMDLPFFRHYMSALAVFNGDVLLADKSPTGSLFIILGDFTGHGLPAAIGSMPLASTFHGMVGKGFTLSDIVREINGKLNTTLPVGLFCCATAIDINFSKKRMLVWSGGLPDGILYRAKTSTYERICSKNLPLGILHSREFKAEPVRYSVEQGDHILMCSDGIQEARSESGEMYGEDRVETILNQCLPADEVYDAMIKDVQQHIGNSGSDDDLSLIDLSVPDIETANKFFESNTTKRGSLADWNMSLKLNASSIRTFDPLPLLVNIISEVPGLRQNSSVLYTVLSELYNNAVEHGVLGLESSLKSSGTGFTEYYRLREEGLAQLQDDWITIDFEHKICESSGLLVIRIADSGPGFLSDSCSSDGPEKLSYFGRGLRLISSICEDVKVFPPGNIVETHFRWSFES